MTALYLTWILLLLFSIVLYNYGKKDFASPSFFLALSFLASFTVVIYNIKNWDIEIHGYYWKTTSCILAAIISFTLGSVIVSSILSQNNVNTAIAHFQIVERNRSYPYSVFCFLSVVLLFLFIHFKIKNIALSSLISFMDALRANYISGKERNFFTSQILEVIVALAYISFHRIMIEEFYLRKKYNKILLVPIIIFLFATLLYTDRNIFLRFMIFGLCSFIMSFNWKGITAKNNRKISIYALISVLLISVLFWLYGHLKEYTSNFERMIGIYMGSGLYGFNLWLKDFHNEFSDGKLMFSSVLRTLNVLGIGPGTNYSQYFDFIIYRSKNNYVLSTNIYSALRIYYQDFGMIGIIIVSVLMGIIFESLYQKAIKRKYGFWWFFYCAHIYHILYFPIAEQFLLRFHLGLIYEIFWLWFFYYLVYGKNGLWRIRIKGFYLYKTEIGRNVFR